MGVAILGAGRCFAEPELGATAFRASGVGEACVGYTCCFTEDAIEGGGAKVAEDGECEDGEDGGAEWREEAEAFEWEYLWAGVGVEAGLIT